MEVVKYEITPIWKKKQDTLWTGWGADSSEMMAIYVIYVYILNISAYLRDQIKSCFFSSCKFARDLFKGRVLFFYPRGFFHQEIPELINLRSNRPRRELLESPLFSGVKWPSGKPMYQAIFFGAPCHSIGFWTHQTYFQIHELRINV